MTDHPYEWLKDQPAAAVLLQAYAHSETAAAANRPAKSAAPVAASDDETSEGEESDDAASWLPRITQLDDVEAATMPALHGRLIALGLLKFELFGRSGGMRYRLSPLGRRALEAPATAVGAEAEESHTMTEDVESEPAIAA